MFTVFPLSQCAAWFSVQQMLLALVHCFRCAFVLGLVLSLPLFCHWLVFICPALIPRLICLFIHCCVFMTSYQLYCAVLSLSVSVPRLFQLSNLHYHFNYGLFQFSLAYICIDPYYAFLAIIPGFIYIPKLSIQLVICFGIILEYA